MSFWAMGVDFLAISFPKDGAKAPEAEANMQAIKNTMNRIFFIMVVS